MNNLLHYASILATLTLLVCVSFTTLTAEEEAAEKKVKAATANGIVSAVDAAGKKITLTLEAKKKKKSEDEAGDEGEKAEAGEAAEVKTLTVTCDDNTVIKAGKDAVELSTITKDTAISVKYNPESNVASSIRVKKKREAKEGDADGEKKEKKKKKAKPEDGMPPEE